MKVRVAHVSLFVLLLFGVPPAAGETFPLSGDPFEAVERFERFGCVECHAIGTEGEGEKAGPNLGALHQRASFMAGTSSFWNHIPGMSRKMAESRLSWPQIGGEDLLDLVALFTTYPYYLTRLRHRGDPERGRLLFQERGCVSCHPFDATSKLAPPFAFDTSILQLARIFWRHGEIVKGERNRRPFREGEMADIVAFLESSAHRRRFPETFTRPGAPDRGRSVFQAAGCGRCHESQRKGVRRKGKGAPAPSEFHLIDDTDVPAVLWNHAVAMRTDLQRTGLSLKPWKNEDLADLIAYLFFAGFIDPPGDPDRGETIFQQKGCSQCHTTGGGSEDDRGEERIRISGAETSWDVLAMMWRKALQMRERMVKKQIEWPKLSPQEMADLTAYLARSRIETSDK
ncbi:MAG: hypothetical protein D6795_12580 [Deltaproteobacteria bacterium]|nr:MAG: hypothetical protein D6795_12580 [Deltaproteobacteria bacterium]